MLETAMTSRDARPWYQRSEELVNLASRYISGLRAIPADEKHHAQVRAYADFSVYQMIFESNLIEKVGTNKLSETRRLVENEFPKLPDTYQVFLTNRLNSSEPKVLHSLLPDDLRRAMRLEKNLRDTGRDIRASISYGSRSRPILEVLQHYTGYLLIAGRSVHYIAQRLLTHRQQILLAHPELEVVEPNAWESLATEMAKLEALSDSAPALITENFIKAVHKEMTVGLLPSDCGVSPGEYRNDVRSAGLDKVYPAPELIPDMMRVYVEGARQMLHDGTNPIARAAWVSYRLVHIHPFPDGNGRLSRLLMVLSLFLDGVPFAVSIRGDAKGKKRYLQALVRADRGDFRAMNALVAMSVVGAFQTIDNDLMSAGLPSILRFAE